MHINACKNRAIILLFLIIIITMSRNFSEYIIKSIFESSNNYDIYGYLINFVKTNKISDSISLGIIVSKLVSYLSLNIGVAQDGNVFNWIEPSCNNKFNKIKSG